MKLYIIASKVTRPGDMEECWFNGGNDKGTGDFEWCRQTMDELSVFGTSRTSNELKSEP